MVSEGPEIGQRDLWNSAEGSRGLGHGLHFLKDGSRMVAIESVDSVPCYTVTKRITGLLPSILDHLPKWDTCGYHERHTMCVPSDSDDTRTHNTTESDNVLSVI